MPLRIGIDISSVGGTANPLISADLSWLSTSGLGVTGSSVDSWDPATGTSATLSQTGTARPTRTATVFGSSYGITFDGSNDYLKTATHPISSAAGSLGIVFKTGSSVTGPMVLVSQGCLLTTNDYWNLGIASDGRLFFEYSNSLGAINIKGSSILEASTVYYAFISHDGTDTYLELNGTEENPLVNTTPTVTAQHWLGEVEGATVRLTLGAVETSGGVSQFFNGSIGGVWIWNTDITA